MVSTRPQCADCPRPVYAALAKRCKPCAKKRQRAQIDRWQVKNRGRIRKNMKAWRAAKKQSESRERREAPTP